jgi:hypothetical protein
VLGPQKSIDLAFEDSVGMILLSEEPVLETLCKLGHGDTVESGVRKLVKLLWNPKTLYEQVRMSPIRKVFDAPFRLLFRSMSPFDDWGLDYDNYNRWFETRR